MQIQNVPSRLLAPWGLGSRADAAEAASDTAVAAATAAGSATDAGVASESYHDILARYDVHHITPRELSHLIEELHAAGAIGPAELQDLARIRWQLDRENLPVDEPLNLVEWLADRVARAAGDAAADSSSPLADAAEQAEHEAGQAADTRALALLERIAVVQGLGPAAGVDLRA